MINCFDPIDHGAAVLVAAEAGFPMVAAGAPSCPLPLGSLTVTGPPDIADQLLRSLP